MESGNIDPVEGFAGMDELGFVRKERNNMGIVLWVAVGIAAILLNRLPGDYSILAIPFWPVSAYLLLVAIQMASSHDINTWKGTPRVKFWIFLANLIGGLPGLIVYDLLKRREKKYLKKRLAF